MDNKVRIIHLGRVIAKYEPCSKCLYVPLGVEDARNHWDTCTFDDDQAEYQKIPDHDYIQTNSELPRKLLSTDDSGDLSESEWDYSSYSETEDEDGDNLSISSPLRENFESETESEEDTNQNPEENHQIEEINTSPLKEFLIFNAKSAEIKKNPTHEKTEIVRNPPDQELNWRFSCPNCKFRSNRSNNFRRHERTCAKKRAARTCQLCFKVFKTRETLTRHTKDVHMEKQFKCTICKSEFARRNRFVEHTKKHHPEKS
ncbi:hypermethylated in cancer 2 protein-like [Culicoides brevitarsis]|uniref:hypermethylated in cancer 2 protein-like n=1 Tax=Culicoides brevitarsis TaxID=469753 RepID=UPI00307C4FF5